MDKSWQELKKQLVAVLSGVFKEPEFRVLLTLGCGKNYDNLTARGDRFPEKVFEVVEDAERKGWVEELVAAARQANESNAALQEVMAAILAGIEAEGKHFYQNYLPVDLPERPAGTAYGVDKPMEIPRRAQHFHGREKLIDDVLAEIKPGCVVTLYGIGGIGKTAVTAEVVGKLQESGELNKRFPDGVIFHSFYGRPSADIALEHILNCLGQEKKGDLEDNVRLALGGKKLLLILDGTEETDRLSRVVRLGPACGILISSRKREDVFGKGFKVRRLEVEDAEKVLAEWAGRRAAEKVVREEICDLVGCLPLAVRLAGKYMASIGLTAGEYRDWLHESELEALEFGERRNQSVTVLMDRSVLQVSEEAQNALAVVGVLALAPFRVVSVAAVLGKSIRDVQKDLGELVNFGLLERPNQSYVVSHPLVHTYASTKMKLETEQLLNLADYYTALFKEETPKGAEGFKRLDEERPHIMQLINTCEKREEWRASENLVWAVMAYLFNQGHGSEWIETLNAGVRAAQKTGNRRDKGAHLGNLGNAYSDLGQVEQAIDYYEQALNIAQEIGDRHGEGNRLGNLGNAYADLGQVEQAIAYYEQALNIAQKIGDRRGEGNRLGNLGNIYLGHLGQVAQAIDYYEQALKITQEIGDRRREGNHLGNLGEAYFALRQVDEALDLNQQALVIAREVGNKSHECYRLGYIGEIYFSKGEVEKAIDLFWQGLAIAQEIGNRRHEGNHLGNLGKAYRSLGQKDEARNYLQQSLKIFEEIKDQRAEEIRGILGEMEEG